MEKTRPICIQNARAVTPEGVEVHDILIRDGKIAAVGKIATPDGARAVDASGLIALPGAVDSHVHFEMPTAEGGRNADDFYAGSMGAVCGGTTSVVDFASPVEGGSWTDGISARRARAGGRVYCDYGLHMEVTGEFDQDIARLYELRDAGVRVLKIYTTYGADRYPREKLPALFGQAKRLGLAILAHCEDDDILQQTKRQMLANGQIAASLHAKSRPAGAEVSAVRELVALSERTGAELIVAHVSTGEAGLMIAQARRRGAPVHAETCMHYLLLNDGLYDGLEPQRYIMTPPLRKPEDCETLWELLASGDIGMVSSDHCPFPLRQRLAEPTCFGAAPGVDGCEALVSLLFSEGYQKGRLTLPQLTGRLSGEAARRYGFYPKKGALRGGLDADIALIDPCAKRTLSAAHEHGKAGYSIWEGFEVGCTPRYVFLRGKLVSRDGEPVGEPGGEYLSL
jgi:dihydropyrimidinase